MLKLEGNLNLKTGEFKIKSTGKKSNTIEHLLIIVEIMKNIMKNDDQFNKDEILSLVSSMYDADIKGEI